MNLKPYRVAAVVLAVLSIPAGLALASQVTGTSNFISGTPIRAADMNANFTAVKSAVDDNHARLTTLEGANLEARLAALEAAQAARQSYFVGQGGTDANASVDESWVDVPGMVLPVTLATAGNIRYQLFGRVYNYGAAPGTTTSCSVRIVQDATGTPLHGVAPATAGDWNSTLVGGDGQPGNDKQLALGGLTNLPAGDYLFKVQIVRHTKATENSGNCSIFRWPFSRAQLFVDLAP
jgi:hypothetical protein